MSNLQLGADKYDANRTRRTLHQIATIYRQTKLDESFQRLGSVFNGSGWSYRDSCTYLDSLLEGSVENKLILAKVDSCLHHATMVGCKNSVKYFEEIRNDGYSYISIDGNNSSSTIFAFTENVPVGKKKIRNKEEYEDVYLKSKYLEDHFPSTGGLWANLDPEARLDLQASEKLDVTVYSKILLDEMCTKFRNFNKSTHLNAQEYRQARRSDLASFVRQLVRDSQSAFLSLSYKDPASIDQRKPDEELACFILKVESEFTKNLARKDLDQLYEQERIKDSTSNVVSLVMKDYRGIDSTLPEPLKTKLSKAKTQALWETIRLTHLSGFSVKNYNAFFEWFLKADAQLVSDSKKVIESESEERSYTHWSGRYTKKTFYTKISDVLKISFASSMNELLEKRVISKTRKSSEIFKHDQKLDLLVLQGWKTRDGQTISALDLYTGQLHADHVKSVSSGGETITENGEMMFAATNLKKGSDSWPPYFDHQTHQEKSQKFNK